MWRNHHQPSYLQILSGGMFDIYIYIIYNIYILMLLLLLIMFIYVYTFRGNPRQPTFMVVLCCFSNLLESALTSPEPITWQVQFASYGINAAQYAAELSGPRPFRNPWEMGFLGDIFYMKLKGPWILNDVGHFGGLWLIVFIEFVWVCFYGPSAIWYCSSVLLGPF